MLLTTFLGHIGWMLVESVIMGTELMQYLVMVILSTKFLELFNLVQEEVPFFLRHSV